MEREVMDSGLSQKNKYESEHKFVDSTFRADNHYADIIFYKITKGKKIEKRKKKNAGTQIRLIKFTVIPYMVFYVLCLI